MGHYDSHVVFVSLVMFGEPAVVLAEMLLLCVFIKEKRKLVTAAYTVAANVTSLVLGWKVIDLFPL